MKIPTIVMLLATGLVLLVGCLSTRFFPRWLLRLLVVVLRRLTVRLLRRSGLLPCAVFFVGFGLGYDVWRLLPGLLFRP